MRLVSTICPRRVVLHVPPNITQQLKIVSYARQYLLAFKGTRVENNVKSFNSSHFDLFNNLLIFIYLSYYFTVANTISIYFGSTLTLRCSIFYFTKIETDGNRIVQ